MAHLWRKDVVESPVAGHVILQPDAELPLIYRVDLRTCQTFPFHALCDFSRVCTKDPFVRFPRILRPCLESQLSLAPSLQEAPPLSFLLGTLSDAMVGMEQAKVEDLVTARAVYGVVWILTSSEFQVVAFSLGVWSSFPSA